MPAADTSEIGSQLRTSERIKLLRLACAGDRLELALTTRPVTPTVVSRMIDAAHLSPIIDTAAMVAAPFLPRKLRLVIALARAWKRARDSRHQNPDPS